jgi:sensor histidine kinase regulating citrate/malate metabolism
VKKIKKILPVSQLDIEHDRIYRELSSVKLPKGCLDLLTYIISELFANVKEHSFAKKIKFEIYSQNNFFYFTLADDGIGIRSSFLQNGIFAKDDRAAIELAVGGMSTKKTNERAFGLFSTQRLAGYVGGQMSIFCGNVKAIFEKNKTRFEKLKRIIKGVKVEVVIPLKAVNIYEVLY